jgi:hypothetical protein
VTGVQTCALPIWGLFCLHGIPVDFRLKLHVDI